MHFGYYVLLGASPGFGRGGARIFFPIWKIACREATCCAWRSHALCKGGSGACPPEKIFLNGEILVRFGVYFDQILSLKNIKKLPFFM